MPLRPKGGLAHFPIQVDVQFGGTFERERTPNPEGHVALAISPILPSPMFPDFLGIRTNVKSLVVLFRYTNGRSTKKRRSATIVKGLLQRGAQMRLAKHAHYAAAGCHAQARCVCMRRRGG